MSRERFLRKPVVAFFSRFASDSLLNRTGREASASPSRRSPGRRGRRPAERPTRPLRLEPLERRQLLSGNPTFTFGSVTVPQPPVPQGQTVTVPVTIADPGNNILSVDLTLQYNSNEMTLNPAAPSSSVVQGAWATANGLTMNDNVIQSAGTGNAYVSLYTTSPGGSSGTASDVVDLKFTVAAGATAGVYPLIIQAAQINENQGGETTNIVDGTFTIPIGVTISGTPGGNTSPEGTQINLSSTVVGAAAGAQNHWIVTSTNPQSIPEGTGSTFSFTPSNIGAYTVTDTVTDSAGNTGTATTGPIIVTEVNPVVTITPGPNTPATPAEGSSGNTYTFTTSDLGAGRPSAWYRLPPPTAT